MKAQKQYELLNSEGSILSIEKIRGIWHWKFSKNEYFACTPIEILDFFVGDHFIYNSKTEKTIEWKSFPKSMKPSVETMKEIIKTLTIENIQMIIEDTSLFQSIYM